MVLEAVALGISLASLSVSGLTAWATLRRGTIKMTRPTVIYFGPDGGARGVNKVFLRTILYSTGARGRIIEEMYLKLHRGGNHRRRSTSGSMETIPCLAEVVSKSVPKV